MIRKIVASAVIAALWVAAPGLPCYQAMAQGVQSGANPGGLAVGSAQPGSAWIGPSLIQANALVPAGLTTGKIPLGLSVTGGKVWIPDVSVKPLIGRGVSRPLLHPGVLSGEKAATPLQGAADPKALDSARGTLDQIHETAVQPNENKDPVAASQSLSHEFDQKLRREGTPEGPAVVSEEWGESVSAQKRVAGSKLSPAVPKPEGTVPAVVGKTNDLIDPGNLDPLLHYDAKTWTTQLSLHAHSKFSDGELSPEVLAKKFFEAGLTEVALTDHDTVDGQERFIRECQKLGLKVHTGIELTAGDGTHVVVLDFDIYDATLTGLLERTKEWRLKRAQAYIAHLNALPELKENGIVITLREVLAKTVNGMIERPHIAQVLVDKGIVKTVDEAFQKKYLGFAIKDPDVLELEPTPEHVMAAVRSSGGKAFLAHPYTIPPGMPNARQLLGMGMHGIEGYRPGWAATREEEALSQGRLKEYLLLAHDMNLWVMPGSDYHGPNTHLNQFVVPMPNTLAGQVQQALDGANRVALAKIQEKLDKNSYKADAARSIKAALIAGAFVALLFLWPHLTFGIAGSIFLSFGGLPQIVKNYKEGLSATKDLAFPSFLIWFSVTILLTSASILKQSNIAWIGSNISGIFRSSLIIGQISLTRHDPSILKKTLGVAAAIGVAVLPAFFHLFFSPAIWARIFFSGALALIMTLNGPQIRDNYLHYQETGRAPQGLQWLSTAVVTAGSILHLIAAISTGNILWMMSSITATIMTSIVLGQLFFPKQTNAALSLVMPAFLKDAKVVAAVKDRVVRMVQKRPSKYVKK